MMKRGLVVILVLFSGLGPVLALTVLRQHATLLWGLTFTLLVVALILALRNRRHDQQP